MRARQPFRDDAASGRCASPAGTASWSAPKPEIVVACNRRLPLGPAPCQTCPRAVAPVGTARRHRSGWQFRVPTETAQGTNEPPDKLRGIFELAAEITYFAGAIWPCVCIT